MKYSFNASSTESETLGFYTLVEHITTALIQAVAEEARRSAERRPLVEPVAVAAAETEPVVPDTAPPAEPSPVVLDERAIRHIEKGRTLFAELVVLWASNLGIEGAPQPDRVGLLRNVATGPDSGAVLHYVSIVGGLTHATDAAMGIEAFRLKRLVDHVGDDEAPIYLRATETPEEEESARRACVAAVSINIAQVSSLFFSDLCAMYEHRDIYRKD
jgi:hypothetical protein